jgi:hypothetical protein
VLQVDDPDQHQPSARELHRDLGTALGRWYRAGAGWWEARIVWQPKLIFDRDPESGDLRDLDLTWHPYSPYFYRHWRADGQQHTQYLGTAPPDDYLEAADPTLPAPERITELHPLTEQARALAQRLLAARDQAHAPLRRQRLTRARQRAARRTLRRFRAENRPPPGVLAQE